VTGEAELGLVIGREARGVSEEDAPSVVAGLTTVLDMTVEDILRRNPRYLTRATRLRPASTASLRATACIPGNYWRSGAGSSSLTVAWSTGR